MIYRRPASYLVVTGRQPVSAAAGRRRSRSRRRRTGGGGTWRCRWRPCCRRSNRRRRRRWATPSSPSSRRRSRPRRRPPTPKKRSSCPSRSSLARVLLGTYAPGPTCQASARTTEKPELMMMSCCWCCLVWLAGSWLGFRSICMMPGVGWRERNL